MCGADYVENLVPRGGGLHGLRPGQVSSASSSHSPGAVDEAHFSPKQKKYAVRREVQWERSAHGRRRLMRTSTSWKRATSTLCTTMSGGRGDGCRGNSSTAGGCSMTQQSFEFIIGPQILFIVKVLDIGVLPQRPGLGCGYVPVIMQRRLSAIGIFLTCPSLCNDRCTTTGKTDRSYHASVHGGFWKNSGLLARAVRTWKY